MKNRNAILRLVALLLLTVILIMSLSSCLLTRGGGKYITEDELEALLADRLGKTTIENVNDYTVNIENSGNPNLTAAAKGVLSSVRVIANFTKRNSYYGTSSSYSAQGAGVIYKLNKTAGEAYIITNFHVVYDSQSNTTNHISTDINLRLYGQDDVKYNIPAVYVGGSMTYDLAVLKVTGSSVIANSSAMAVTVADSDAVSILDTAIAIGNPASNGISATVGCINVDSEIISMTAADGVTTIYPRLFRIDTAVNNGNSGGGLFNDRGELIGIVNAKMSSSTVDNIGYAIPSNVAEYVAENIIRYCDGTDNERAKKYYIGINLAASELYTDYDKESGKVHKRETVTVGEITNTAFAGELFNSGDVIRAIIIDGKRHGVTRTFHVTDKMLLVFEDSTLEIEVQDAEGTRVVPIDLSKITPTEIS